MEDYNLKEAERIGDKIDELNRWVELNQEDILERYKDNLEIEDVPEDFIQSQYELYCEGD